ncbi:hypothetical protein WHR41_07961 [Cladosporium halotolerans]|uniref:BTB domain-containing protein n=1 Tax=Cladosporium halotolerans TaxID=1052096 RepID=A0AB34KHC4_9PEZI
MASQRRTTNDLATNIMNYGERGLHSDLKLICNEHEFAVHKFILSVQSEYFNKLINGPFIESAANTVELHGDESFAVAALIHFLYTNQLSCETTPKFPDQNKPSTFYLRVYEIADKYDCAPLCETAKNEFARSCDATRDMDDFVDAVRIVDACAGNGIIWKILLPRIQDNIDALLNRQDFRDIIVDQPGFTFRLLRLLKSSRPPTEAPPNPFAIELGITSSRGNRGRNARGY